MEGEVKVILEDTKTVNMTLKKLSAAIHEKVKLHQKALMRQRGDKVNLQEAYADALDQATKQYESK